MRRTVKAIQYGILAAGAALLLLGPVAATAAVRVDLSAPETPNTMVPASEPSLDAGVFKSVALPVGKLAVFTQWQRASRVAINEQACWMGLCRSAKGRELLGVAERAKAMPPMAALRFVNRRVNSTIRYRADRGDRWASVTETALRGAGDCEDYALAKRALLMRAGFDADQIQFVILKETRRQLYHAVLAVHVNGTRYILDNLSKAVMPDTVYRSYLPMASFAGSQAYLHGFTDARSQLARGTDLKAISLGQGG